MTRVLLTGVTGQVGWELGRTLPPLGRVIALDRVGLDLTDPDAVRRRVRELAPQVIVNPAAYTAVDRAELEPELAMAVNGIAPGILAEEAARLGAWLVHYSTDYVFDGRKSGPYVEADAPNPQNVYGRTKLAGEQAVQASGCKHLILRTSWVYGARGKNFVQTMLRLGREQDELRVVADQFGTPTWSRGIAEVTAQMLAQLLVPQRDEAETSALAGLYHLTASGETSWYDFAREILALGIPERTIRVSPIATAQYLTPAQRPANSRMSCAKLAQKFGLALPGWRQELALCLAEGC